MDLVYKSIQKDLRRMATRERAEASARFFKTGNGHYGEGDVFLGVRVPDTRAVIKKYFKEATLDDALVLLDSKYHEERFAGVILMVEMFKKTQDEFRRKKIFIAYLKHTNRVNNWDLVDVSARDIVGGYLLGRDRAMLYKLVRSRNIWERRIAIIATGAFIKNGDPKDTFALAEILLADTHDLLHKATGWMLREVEVHCGAKTLDLFLEKYAQAMPRTMLRYAIEHHTLSDRMRYMAMR